MTGDGRHGPLNQASLPARATNYAWALCPPNRWTTVLQSASSRRQRGGAHGSQGFRMSASAVNTRGMVDYEDVDVPHVTLECFRRLSRSTPDLGASRDNPAPPSRTPGSSCGGHLAGLNCLHAHHAAQRPNHQRSAKGRGMTWSEQPPKRSN